LVLALLMPVIALVISPVVRQTIFHGRGDRIAPAVSLLFLSMAYALGLVEQADVLLDHKPSAQYRVLVADKHVVKSQTGGRRSSTSSDYYVRLTQWSPARADQEFQVSMPFYNAVRPGAHLCLSMHPGALAIPWYVYRAC